MPLTPVLNHLALNPVVLGTPIPSYTAWPSICIHTIKKDDLHGVRPLVASAGQIDDEARMPIHTAMNVEAPWT
jgi:hypothetical protein